MQDLMRIPIWLTLIAALVALVVIVVIGQALIAPQRPLITDARLRARHHHAQRRRQRRRDHLQLRLVAQRARHPHLHRARTAASTASARTSRASRTTISVAFSGVVDGFTLPGEVVRRPDYRAPPDPRRQLHLAAAGDRRRPARPTSAAGRWSSRTATIRCRSSPTFRSFRPRSRPIRTALPTAPLSTSF